MFGINASALNGQYRGTNPPPFATPAVPSGLPYYSVQEYLESDDVGAFNVVGSTGTSTEVTSATEVPFQTFLEDIRYWVIRTRTQTSEGHWNVGLQAETGAFYAIYKDVHVLPVPRSRGGGWLMLAGRYLVKSDDVTGNNDAERYHNANDRCAPGKCLSDIVAFWASDWSFTSDPAAGRTVRGPFPLISGLRALSDTDTMRFRAWVGVPAGFFDGGDLYVYYSAQPDVASRSADSAGGTSYVDTLTDDTLADAIESLGDGTGVHGDPGNIFGDASNPTTRTYVARFPASLVDALLATDPADETDWDVSHAWPDSELRRPIRSWYAARRLDGSAAFHAFEDEVGGGTFTPWVVDAVPYVCDGELLLFTSVQPPPGTDWTPLLAQGTMLGLWRARGLPTGLDLPNGQTAVYGLDFLSGGDDQIVASYRVRELLGGFTYVVYKDPDPYRWVYGWTVYSGQGDRGKLAAFDGSAECPVWEDAWGDGLALPQGRWDWEAPAAGPSARDRAGGKGRAAQAPDPFPLDHPSAPVRPDPLPGLHARALPLPSVLSQRDTAFEAFHQRVTAHAIQG